MPIKPTEFDHLDHVLNDLVDHGVVFKTWEQCYAHDFKNGVSCRWRVDPMIAAVGAAIGDGTVKVMTMTAEEVSMFARSALAEGNIDPTTRCPSRPRSGAIPVLVVDVTPDLHPDAGSIVVDGNHRVCASFHDRLPCFYVVVPERIERMFRFKQDGTP